MSGNGSDQPSDPPRTVRVTNEMILDTLFGDEDSDYTDDPDYYLDAEDIQEELGDEDMEDDEYFDEDDEEFPQAFFTADPTTGDIYVDDEDMDEDEDEDEDENEEDYEDVEDDEDDEVDLQEITALLNGAQSAEARNSLLAQLLRGPQGDGGDDVQSSGLLRRLGWGRGPTVEERARADFERRRKERWWTPQLEPHPAGAQLMATGEFGRVRGWTGSGQGRRLTRRCLTRNRHYQWTPSLDQATIPNTHGTVVASYPSIPYVGQYAGEDYGLFYAATQYFTLHLYSTKEINKPLSRKRLAAPSAARSARTGAVPGDDDDEDDGMPWGNWGSARTRRTAPQEDASMKKIKTVQGEEGRWTVTDCDADKKAEKMIYSSITPYVHMLRTAEDDEEHVCLDFSDPNPRRGGMHAYNDFGIWSIRFSSDGKEVVAGAANGKIMVYDIESERRSLAVSGHADDVNAVCFADESSTNVLVSGADDGYVKIWDRRSLSSSTPSGVLVGATEGITYTAPKGDGRYIVANSKDQAARLYDLRKMRSHSEFDREEDAVAKYGQPRFDYRSMRYPPPNPRRLAHPKDCSVMTYRGHQVLKTLIRCHFSPRESTGQSYIYSGSADGMIHIWSLDGRVVQVLNRAKSTDLRGTSGEYNDPTDPDPTNAPQASRRRVNSDMYDMYGYGSSHCVRDVSWHGYEPTLMSTCWEMSGGSRRGGTLAKHEWKGLGKGGMRNLEDWIAKTKAEMAETA